MRPICPISPIGFQLACLKDRKNAATALDSTFLVSFRSFIHSNAE